MARGTAIKRHNLAHDLWAMKFKISFFNDLKQGLEYHIDSDITNLLNHCY